MSDGVSDLGRFAEPSLHILVSLSEGPKHGYAIMTDVEAITGSPMGPGTLYGALARLERRGLIEALEPVDRRRPYRLTSHGRSHRPSPARATPGLRPDRAGATPRLVLLRWAGPHATMACSPSLGRSFGPPERPRSQGFLAAS